MKPSRWISNTIEFLSNITIIEILTILAIIAILAAMLLPAFIKAKQRKEQNSQTVTIQVEQSQTFQVGDSVKVEGLDRRGVINYIHGSDGVDVLMKSADGSPTIIKGVNPKLLSK